MACKLIHLVTALIACLSTLHSAGAAPWVPDLAELGLSGLSSPQPSLPGADSVTADADSVTPDGGSVSPDGSPVLNESGGQTSSPTLDETESASNTQVGMSFNFSANHGTPETDSKEAPVVNNPWADIFPQEDSSSEQDVDLGSIFNEIISIEARCGNLCNDFGDICSGNDKCVILEDCTPMCNKSDGTQIVLQSKYLPQMEERRCDKTGDVCMHGTCQEDQSCQCDLGYEGDKCDTKQCFLPCLHGGTCYRTSGGNVACSCTPDWQGTLCRDKKCTLPCIRGSCIYSTFEGPDHQKITKKFCNCPYGYTGKLCGEKIPDPAASSKVIALAVGIATPIVCLLALGIAWYILWRNRAVFVFKVINMFKAYEDDDDKLYDAYVSLTEGEYAFVKTILQPRLEGMGHKLYMHVRDGVAGDVKSEEILEAVEKSRRCIMLLTSDYINNEWCRFEYLIAQHETCIKLKQRIIPILMDDIDKDKKKMDKTLRFIMDSVKCLRYPRHPIEIETTPTSTTCIQPGGKGDKKLDKFEKELENFWEKLRLTMPKKRDLKKENCPLSTGTSKHSLPYYSKKTGFRSLFSKLSKSLPVGQQIEKSSSSEFSFVEPSSSSDKIGEGNPVALISVSARVDSKLDSFYSDTLERSLTGDCSESSLVFIGADMKGVAHGDVHLNV